MLNRCARAFSLSDLSHAEHVKSVAGLPINRQTNHAVGMRSKTVILSPCDLLSGWSIRPCAQVLQDGPDIFPKHVLKKTQDGTLKSLRTTRGYADRSFPVSFCSHHNANALLSTFLAKCDHTITTYSMRLLIILGPLRCHLGTILGSSGSIFLE